LSSKNKSFRSKSFVLSISEIKVSPIALTMLTQDEGRGIYREREEKGHFGEEKGMFRGRERGVSGRKIAEGIGIGREIN